MLEDRQKPLNWGGQTKRQYIAELFSSLEKSKLSVTCEGKTTTGSYQDIAKPLHTSIKSITSINDKPMKLFIARIVMAR